MRILFRRQSANQDANCQTNDQRSFPGKVASSDCSGVSNLFPSLTFQRRRPVADGAPPPVGRGGVANARKGACPSAAAAGRSQEGLLFWQAKVSLLGDFGNPTACLLNSRDRSTAGACSRFPWPAARSSSRSAGRGGTPSWSPRPGSWWSCCCSRRTCSRSAPCRPGRSSAPPSWPCPPPAPSGGGAAAGGHGGRSGRWGGAPVAARTCETEGERTRKRN